MGCPPGSRYHYSSRKPDALPTQIPGNVTQAPFQCNIPRAAFSTPSRISLYGHGLLGDHTQIEEDNIKDMSAEHDFTFCATDWAGMSTADVPNAIAVLKDISKFPSLADRLQQGIVNTLYLGRLLAHPQGFTANAAFQGTSGRLLLDTSNLYFDSNSQGAILGGLATAVAPDWTRAVLGVATMDYGALLPRSVDFDTYNAIFRPAYPDGGTRLFLVSLIQMLWDRGETDGWAYHVTNKPPRNTPKHTVLLHVAVGDHQVANVMSDVEARTIGASAYRPAVAPGRSTDKTPLFGIPSIGSFPFHGLGDRLLGRRPADPAGPGTQHPEPGRARPARVPAQHRGGPQPEVGVPLAERLGDRRVRRPALPHRQLQVAAAGRRRAGAAGPAARHLHPPRAGVGHRREVGPGGTGRANAGSSEGVQQREGGVTGAHRHRLPARERTEAARRPAR